MTYVNCPRCGLTALTFARWSTVDACPYCGAPIRRENLVTEDRAVDNNGRADNAALQGDPAITVEPVEMPSTFRRSGSSASIASPESHATYYPSVQIGMVGLGRMGGNMVRRLMRDGHECVVYARDPDSVAALAGEGATGSESLDDFVAKLDKPRTAWAMVPAGAITEGVVRDLADRLEPGDAIVDGGNTYYHDDIRRAAELAERGIDYIDCGTSGGVFGLERGYCLMIGGPDEAVARLEPVFASLAPGVEAAERTPGREGEPSPAELGYLHCGPSGAGHFVKMVHNGIEYGLMAAYAEGLNILRNANAGAHQREADAETAPLEHPEHYQYEIDVAEVTELWRRGSVVGSWLLDLTAAALSESPTLEEFEGRVSDSGEGRWTSIAAIDEGVPAPVLSTALYSRFASRGLDDFAGKVLSAMRKQFGGHEEKPG